VWARCFRCYCTAMLARLLRWWRGRSAADRDRVLHDLPEVMLSTTDTLVERFSFHGIDSAFIGGIALAMHGLPRATRDIDFIIDAGSADSADALMAELGFERLQRSDIFGNYWDPCASICFLPKETEAGASCGELSPCVCGETSGNWSVQTTSLG
jgi:hypothetical protein